MKDRFSLIFAAIVLCMIAIICVSFLTPTSADPISDNISITEKTVDGCQYLVFTVRGVGVSALHKANCSNPYHTNIEVNIKK